MIPPGSKMPDYQQRLKFAFRDEKRIVKQQDRLKQVQHMFMFMTTCWMYQLPSHQAGQAAQTVPTPRLPPSLPSSTTSSGAFQTPTSQAPMQFSLKGFGGMHGNQDYEAVLTLNPIRQPEGISRPLKAERERTSQRREKGSIPNTRKESLENMRRSPYFSLDLLKRPVEPPRHSRTADDPALGMQEEKIRILIEGEERRRAEIVRMEERTRMEYREDLKYSRESEVKDRLEVEEREERRDFEPISKKQAERDVGDLISEARSILISRNYLLCLFC